MEIRTTWQPWAIQTLVSSTREDRSTGVLLTWLVTDDDDDDDDYERRTFKFCKQLLCLPFRLILCLSVRHVTVRWSSSNATVLSERTALRGASCYSALRLSRLDFCLLLRVNIGWAQTTSLGLIHCVPKLDRTSADCTAITACCTSISSKRPSRSPSPSVSFSPIGALKIIQIRALWNNNNNNTHTWKIRTEKYTV